MTRQQERYKLIALAKNLQGVASNLIREECDCIVRRYSAGADAKRQLDLEIESLQQQIEALHQTIVKLRMDEWKLKLADIAA